MITIILAFLLNLSLIGAENVLITEVFAITIEPTLFNWTYQGLAEQYVYQPSLLDAPDLPSWINYIYSEQHHCGFLYGVPPNENDKEYRIEIIALNRENYETRRIILPIHITEKLNPAKYEVQVKIDNLNVDDMFDVERMERLKDIFRKKLWKDSQNDLYITFLASAVKLGARLPLRPNEGEGVVLRIGSTAVLSNELIELQEEVKPLWKVPSCPRDFKRTTVERLFRENGFALDWCSFRLLEDKSDNEELVNSIIEESNLDRWVSISKIEIPERSYANELVSAIIIPMVILVLMAVILSTILCFHHNDLDDPKSEEFFQYLYHICTDYFSNQSTETSIVDRATCNSTSAQSTPKPTHTLRSLANQTETNCLSPDSVLISRSCANSPNGTVGRSPYCRPSPPPYVRPKNKPNF